MILTSCFACANGLYQECANLQPIEGDPDHFLPCYNKAATEAVETTEKGESGRRVLEPHEITDVTSTGRKRAAQLYPIYDGMICEWAGLLYAGGGVKTIVGCKGNVLVAERGGYARHHGFDKNTLENGPGNVHRICPTCHNRWHAMNDEFYGERPPAGQPFLPVGYECIPHDPKTRASEQDIEDNEEWWATAKLDRKATDD